MWKYFLRIISVIFFSIIVFYSVGNEARAFDCAGSTHSSLGALQNCNTVCSNAGRGCLAMTECFEDGTAACTAPQGCGVVCNKNHLDFNHIECKCSPGAPTCVANASGCTDANGIHDNVCSYPYPNTVSKYTCAAGNFCQLTASTCANGCTSGACNLILPPSVCPDFTCSGTETSATCPADCPAGTCDYDNLCDTGETNATCPGDCLLPVPFRNVKISVRCPLPNFGPFFNMATIGTVKIISKDHYSYDFTGNIIPSYIYTDPFAVSTQINFEENNIPFGDYELSAETDCGVGSSTFTLSNADPDIKVISMFLGNFYCPTSTHVDDAAPFLTCNEICKNAFPSQGCVGTTGCGSSCTGFGCNYKCDNRTECECSLLKVPCSVGDTSLTVASSCTGFDGSVVGVFNDSCLNSSSMIKYLCGATGNCEPIVSNCVFGPNLSCTANKCGPVPPPLVCPNCGLGGGVCDCGETYETCPSDCPYVPTPPPPPACPACGNGVCDCGETPGSCAADCPPLVAPPLANIIVKPIGTVSTGINDWLLGIIAGLAILMIILGGIRYMASWGNPAGIGASKKMITYVVLGLVVVLVSYSAVLTLDKIIGGGASAISITNTSVTPLSGPLGTVFTIKATIIAAAGVNNASTIAHIQSPDETDFIALTLLPIGGGVYSITWTSTAGGPYFVDINACDVLTNCNEANNI